MKRIIAIALIATLSGCTENARTRSIGGTQTTDIAAGRKVVNVTWKDANMWILTRPMHDGEMPETLTFHESSSFGVFEGTVILREHAAKGK